VAEGRVKWKDLRKGDVIHYTLSEGDESYLLLEDPRPDRICVRYRVLLLDDGAVYDDVNVANGHIPTPKIRIERTEGE
jgi:hypothetical protein